jgi:hypothetical protein
MVAATLVALVALAGCLNTNAPQPEAVTPEMQKNFHDYIVGDRDFIRKAPTLAPVEPGVDTNGYLDLVDAGISGGLQGVELWIRDYPDAQGAIEAFGVDVRYLKTWVACEGFTPSEWFDDFTVWDYYCTLQQCAPLGDCYDVRIGGFHAYGGYDPGANALIGTIWFSCVTGSGSRRFSINDPVDDIEDCDVSDTLDVVFDCQ